MAVPGNGKLLALGNARSLYQLLAKGIQEAKNALKAFQGEAITVWAVFESRRLQHILGAVWEAAAT